METVLANGLRVTEITAKGKDRLAAALIFPTGSNADPHHRPGLAHLMEHILARMVFDTVREKYGGHLDASTTEIYTVFAFDICGRESSQFLKELLDCFFAKEASQTEHLERGLDDVVDEYFYARRAYRIPDIAEEILGQLRGVKGPKDGNEDTLLGTSRDRAVALEVLSGEV
ncbi:hypothetical protein DACRYDRAFT_117401 [Dacryopinax primogenitus]|uniref:Peptidase M16 N-terminal domain-containing protein n=1 Tax=Dacryopinax primogenitus (strain DJM 731) TaxID=1858805 RepID=M5FXD4_DACPD|nr:uncharacterized protein DACRYDRAFT_117401 [Dacryopinax primogenitus]EJU00440.1 hypothetical protein DACRYDRAFT_117401 [Dacryopinax primogenitus]